MTQTKSKWAAVVLVTLGLAAGAGMATHRSPAEPAQSRADEKQVREKQTPARKSDPLAGNWIMALPAGFRYEVNVRLLEADCYVLEKAVRFSGVYERRRNRLVMVKPADRNEGGFEWEIDDDCLILVKQPPVEKLGSDYRGATLKRTGRASERSKAAADDPVLTIEIRPVAKDGKPVVPKFPSHYKLFEKRIQQLEGKRVLELVGTKVSLRLLNNARLNKQKEPFTAAEFTCAILRGRIVSSAKMVYDLQRAEECLVTTPRGDFRVGIFYSPVGYIVLPNGECYWFFFDEKSK